MAKKGAYRKLVRVEIIKATAAREVGVVCEMHPVLAKRLIADEKAKKSTKALTNVPVVPKISINKENQ